MTIAELLATHSKVLDELGKRGVLRSKNNPTGDYGEWLVSKAMELTLAGNSAKGYDATDKQGLRYQIKCRRVTPSNPSTQLSVIRNLGEANFDFLLAVIFDENWEVTRAVKIAHSAIAKLATYRDHVNGHVMYVRPSILTEPGIEDVSSLLRTNGVSSR